MLSGQLRKSTGLFRFVIMSASAINAIRRALAEMPCIKRDLLNCRIKGDKAKSYYDQKVSYKQNISNKLSEELYKEACVRCIRKPRTADRSSS